MVSSDFYHLVQIIHDNRVCSNRKTYVCSNGKTRVDLYLIWTTFQHYCTY